jgi:predicted ATPase/DNA-binding winged helix-turn-helix (wHTH) protein
MSSDGVQPLADREYTFGPFRFIPAQHLLLQGEAPLRLGSRALEILKVLVEQAGELVSKQELMERVWPKTVVEDSNLKVHVAALRRALGEQKDDNNYIVTVSGRGYRFAAQVSSTGGAQVIAPAQSGRLFNLPCLATRMIGRTATLAGMLQTMKKHRLVSIVGPGGVGKTTVALSIAEDFARQSGMNICFVDLSSLSDGRFLTSAITSALGLTLHAGDGTATIIAHVRERHLLLILDSCEHVIEAAAVLAERIIANAPGVHVLATSREPLRTTGEHVHRLAPLVYPADRQGITAAEAREFPAVQLFSERAAQSIEGYHLTDGDAPAVAEICRRLEGNALAIELAATRIDAFGARELAARLDDRFQLLKRGRRGAQERHSTLAAALDWSYDFLREGEQALLRCLSVFAGPFTLDAALALCSAAPSEAAVVMDDVANLVAKSLLSADVGGEQVHYRLADTTKAYAIEKLEQRGELEALRRRHAESQCTMLGQAVSEWEAYPSEDWLNHHARGLDDVRAALAWAMSPDGEPDIGIALTVAAIPLWMHLSLLEECRSCVDRALSTGLAQPVQEMKLHTALAAAILYTHGPLDASNEAWERTMELADQLADTEYQLCALWGLAVYRAYAGDHQSVRELADRFRAIAASRSDRPSLVSVDRLVGTALHYGGEQQAARRELERMLQQYVPPELCVHVARHQLDQRSAALATLANVLWLQGYPDQAVQTIEAALQEARKSEHMPSLLNTLAQSIYPVMFNVGDYAGASKLLDELSGHLGSHALPTWDISLRCLRAMLQVQSGDLSAMYRLHTALGELHAAGYHLRFNSYLGSLAAGLEASGRRDKGLRVIDDALACCEAGKEHWCLSELLRIKGTLLEASDAAAAEEHFKRALSIARQQGAVSWELRIASSLTQLKARQGAQGENRELLEAVYGKFTEGFSTADLRRAKALIDGRDPSRSRTLIH